MRLVKYPRTRHVSWSRSVEEDDKVHHSMSQFLGREVVVTEKMDGESCTIYHNGYSHARSIDSRTHASRNWVKSFAGSIGHLIPNGYRICGENVYAEHSIAYANLATYFYGFSVWDDDNICLGWDETLEYFNLMGVTPVRTLYRGLYDEELIKHLWDESQRDVCEGNVTRIVDAIHYKDFPKYVGKFVRKGHVQTDEHWMTKEIIPNRLRNT